MVYSTIIAFNAIWFQGFDGLADLLHGIETGILSYHTLTQNLDQFPMMNFHWLVHLSILTNI